MARYVVAKVSDLEAGGRLALCVRGRPIVIFNLNGEYHGLLDRCPHQGAQLSAGLQAGIYTSSEPGVADVSNHDGFIRCPWHGWEFDIRTGQSWFDPEKVYTRQLPTEKVCGSALMEGPFKAERIEVQVDDEYLVVDL